MAAHQGAGGGLNGLGQFLSALFSRPRLTWAALALAAASFLVVSPSALGIAAEDSWISLSRLVALALLLVALAFLTLNLLIDAAKAATSRIGGSAGRANTSLRFERLPPDAKAILKYLALNSENIITLETNHPGVIPLRSANFLYVSSNLGDICELETRSGVFEWLQNNLDRLADVDVADGPRLRLLESIEKAHEKSKYSWMA